MRLKLNFLIAALALALGLTSSAAATTIGPDAFGYTATNSIPFAFTDISGTGTQLFGAGVDDTSLPAALGFTFDFYGSSYSSVFVSTNGLLTFGSANSSFTNQQLAIGPTQAAIAPLWDDLHTGTVGAVYYATTGAPGSRIFTTQWDDVRHFSSSGSCCGTFQSVLFEGSNVIEFRYADVDFNIPGFSFGNNATVGISGGSASGNYLQWSHNSSVLSNAEAIRFSPGAGDPIPEPSTLLLLGGGLLAGARRLRRSRQ
jgi:hypothetical protein